MMRTIVYIFCFLFVVGAMAQQQSFKKQLDSIQKLRAYTFDTSLSLEERLEYALKSSELAHKTKVDTTILKNDQRLAYIYLLMDNHQKTKNWSYKSLKIAEKLNDSLKIAIINHTLALSYDNQGIFKDSAYFFYYKSKKIYSALKKVSFEISVLSNIAILQEDERDYVNAEINAFKALRLIQSLPQTENNLNTLQIINNLIGIISFKLHNYDKAIEYYNKALENSSKMSNGHKSNLYININIAELYKDQKKYNKAINIYNRLINNNKRLHYDDSLTYSTVISNLAYVKFLRKDLNYGEITSLFKRAYKISSNMEVPYEVSAIGNDFSEFYLSINQKDSALPYLKRSYKLAKQADLNEEVLRSLKLLSQATEGETGKQYLYEYIKLNDSLITKERIARNKFARIKFETDEITEERDKVTKQKSLLFGTSITLVVMLALVYLVFVQRSKNRKLLFEREQQKANESIYSLMLQQQSILEQGRTEERFRISEELHDGILSKLFGTRMGLGFLSKKVNGDASVLIKHSDFINQMQEIETEIRDVSHALKNKLLSSTVDFVAIIEYYIKGLSELHLFDYNVYANPEIPWATINDHTKVNLYRILQEALQNMIKHAQASRVDVSFYMIDKQLELVIKDNGAGFDVNKQVKGIGLKNITSRTKNLNGTIDIASNPDKGTLLTVHLKV
ncbi:tetratricopeptide repeat protein [Flavobacteriaceae bacterium AU392]|nr:tetratricopeptide repeat protein [Flavobacteriaceae bacterium]RKM84207.1 tetratricopeptide repeat protein [Flavobacteriaceae bacterium AU392]